MLNTQLKQGLRLNRTLAFSLLVYGLILALLTRLSPPAAGQSFWAWGRIGGLLGMTALFLLVNETALRTLKRLNVSGAQGPDDFFLEKLSLLLPLASGAYLVLTYLLTGQLAILLLWLIPPLQACLFGHRTLAWGASLLLGALALLSHPFLGALGAPALPPIGSIEPIKSADASGMLLFGSNSFGVGARILLCLTPLAWTFHQ
jgi:hypothetical protein